MSDLNAGKKAQALAYLQKVVKAGLLPKAEVLALYAKLEHPEAPEAGLFHTYDEVFNAPPVEFVVQDFLQDRGITGLPGLSGHGKTFIAGHMSRCLLTGEKVFGHFEVKKLAKKVVYLVPEISLGQARTRFIDLFKFDRALFEKFKLHTLAIRKPKLSDPRLLRESECGDVDLFIDTLPRFMEKAENEVNQEIADDLFNLLGVGFRTVTFLHHSPKDFRNDREMFLERIMRGTGDIGAWSSTVWGVRQVKADKETNLVYVQCVKARDFLPPDQFLLRLRPDIDNNHSISMAKSPGTCGSMAEELDRHSNRVDKEKIAFEAWSDDPKIGRDRLNKLLIAKCGSSVDTNTLQGWLRTWKRVAEPMLELKSEGESDEAF